MIKSRLNSSAKIEISYIPHFIGPYLLDKEIGSGSFSIVYRAVLKKSYNKLKNKNKLHEDVTENNNNQMENSKATSKNKIANDKEPSTIFYRSKSFSTIKKSQVPKFFNEDLYKFPFHEVIDNNISDSEEYDSDQIEINDKDIPRDKITNKHRKLQPYYAIKIYPKSNLESQKDEELFQREINAMAFFHHKNIISLKDILSDDFNFYLVMDYCQGFDLKQYITEKAPDGIDEKNASKIFKQIVSAVSYCHSLGVAHRDLKPENILITSFPNIKISDFGLCGYINEDQLMRTFCGSPCYTAPECLNKIEYDGRQADTWSLGVILYTIVTGNQPWPLNNTSVMIKNILKGKYSVPKNISQPCKSLITGMLNINPKERLTIDQILNHPWLNQNENDEDEFLTTKIESGGNSDESDSSESFVNKIKNYSLTTSKSMTLAEFSAESMKVNKFSDHGIYYPFTIVKEKSTNSSNPESDGVIDNDSTIIADNIDMIKNGNMILDNLNNSTDENDNSNSDVSQVASASTKSEHDLTKSNSNMKNLKNAKPLFPMIKKQRKKPRRSDISPNMSFFKQQNNQFVTFSSSDNNNSISNQNDDDGDKSDLKEKVEEDFGEQSNLNPKSSNSMSKKANSGFTRVNVNVKRPQSQKVLKFPKRSKSHFNFMTKSNVKVNSSQKFP